MKRVDAHQHFWQLAARGGAWPPPNLTPIYRDFDPEDLAPILRQNDVAATVLVQSMPDEADTRFMLDLADRHGFIAAVVGWVDLKAVDAPARIAALAAHPKLRGLRPMLQDLADDHWIDDPALAPAVEAMLRHGLSFDALVLPRHLPALAVFARRFPDLPIVLDHLAKPAMGPVPEADWKLNLERLADLPQVECKLSGMVTEAGPGWTTAQLAPYARHALDLFGPQRVMWGSDWPVIRLAADYAAWMATSEELLAHLDDGQRNAVFRDNARRFYRIAPEGG
ncbi:MAG TPA: amidohydrolase family protein [Telluria sp.]|nr:amidohydrolase family protein [Telluria sp.]